MLRTKAEKYEEGILRYAAILNDPDSRIFKRFGFEHGLVLLELIRSICELKKEICSSDQGDMAKKQEMMQTLRDKLREYGTVTRPRMLCA